MGKYILIADIHLKKAIPSCRTEDEQGWLDIQKKTLEAVRDYAVEHDATIAMVGDIFDTPVASVTMVTMFLDVFLPIKDRVLILAGNHCVVHHNFDNVEGSSYGILRKTFREIPDLGSDSEIGGHHFNTEYSGSHSIVCTHQLVIPNEKDIEIIGSGKTPKALIKEYPNADFIFTGDYHHKFIYKGKNCAVLNPGCSTRQSVKYVDYSPCCYFVDTDNMEVNELPLPDNSADSITTEHRDRLNDRNERLSTFLEVVKSKGTVSLDFIGNLEDAMNNKTTYKEIEGMYENIDKEIIRDILQEIVSGLKADKQ